MVVKGRSQGARKEIDATEPAGQLNSCYRALARVLSLTMLPRLTLDISTASSEILYWESRKPIQDRYEKHLHKLLLE